MAKSMQLIGIKLPSDEDKANYYIECIKYNYQVSKALHLSQIFFKILKNFGNLVILTSL